MWLKYLYFLTAGFCLLLISNCSRQEKQGSHLTFSKKDAVLKYAKRFAIERSETFTLVHVFGNKANPGDTTATYMISSDSIGLPNRGSRSIFIKTPCKKIAALSSIYANMIYDLDGLNRLVAIDNMDYIINPQIVAKYRQGGLKELARGPEPDIEQIVALRPDVVFTFGMGEPGRDVNPKLAKSGIPIAVSIDHLEESPLARAEWIKFYAAFIGREILADSLFSTTEKNYKTLCALAKKAAGRPAVFTEIKYGDTWYVPGGKSYMAQLLEDAGAGYVWKDDPNSGSLPLSFEQVYAKAKDADFWLNLSMVKTKNELLGYEPRYAEFKAFKAGHMYNNNKVVNSKGYSTYWETGMIYPDRILGDLIHIFHPEMETVNKNDLYYYRQIN